MTDSKFEEFVKADMKFDGETVQPSTFVHVDLIDEEEKNQEHQINTHATLKFPMYMQQYNTFSSYYESVKSQYEMQRQQQHDHEQKMITHYNQMFATSQYVPYSTINIPAGWDFIRNDPDLVRDLQTIFIKLKQYITMGYTVFPRESNMFKAFELCPFNNIKVVILGQDPYETIDTFLGIEKATGLAFSGWKEGQVPYSLSRIFTELKRTWPNIRLEHPDLTSWAQQGVFLLNTALTVNKDDANSHGKTGMYKHFIECIIQRISNEIDGVIFCLWGRPAEKYEQFIGKKSYILKCGHPSGRNNSEYRFAENGHFAAIYYYLQSMGKTQIDWSLIK